MVIDFASRLVRPPKELKGFQRVTLAPGETKAVTLRLAAADLAYWEARKHAWVVEPGRVELMVGRSGCAAVFQLNRPSSSS